MGENNCKGFKRQDINLYNKQLIQHNIKKKKEEEETIQKRAQDLHRPFFVDDIQVAKDTGKDV